MLYLLLIAIFVCVYFIAGAMYTLACCMLEDHAWDNTVFVIWPVILWRRWRLHRYIKHQNDKWRNF